MLADGSGTFEVNGTEDLGIKLENRTKREAKANIALADLESLPGSGLGFRTGMNGIPTTLIAM